MSHVLWVTSDGGSTLLQTTKMWIIRANYAQFYSRIKCKTWANLNGRQWCGDLVATAAIPSSLSVCHVTFWFLDCIFRPFLDLHLLRVLVSQHFVPPDLISDSVSTVLKKSSLIEFIEIFAMMIYIEKKTFKHFHISFFKSWLWASIFPRLLKHVNHQLMLLRVYYTVSSFNVLLVLGWP